jgi:hypothetical protein
MSMFRRLTSEQRRQRARVGLIGLGVLLVALAFLSRHNPPARERVDAIIIEVDRGTHADNPIALFTARVRLKDGAEARVVVHEPLPAVGEHVRLIENRHADGNPRYRLVPRHAM